jgi:hypothetical protein
MTAIVASTEVERSAPEVFARPPPIPGASPSGSEAPPMVYAPTGPAQSTALGAPLPDPPDTSARATDRGTSEITHVDAPMLWVGSRLRRRLSYREARAFEPGAVIVVSRFLLMPSPCTGSAGGV